MLFEWDEEKYNTNIKKHGIRFEVAAKVFFDKNRIEKIDTKHSSSEEERYITIGMVEKVLFVSYTERAYSIRLISARKAEKEEIDEYYKNNDVRRNKELPFNGRR